MCILYSTFRASLQNVLFPSVTLCNINQGRSSFFHAYGLSANKTLLNAVLKQAYFGSRQELTKEEVSTFLITFFSYFWQAKNILFRRTQEVVFYLEHCRQESINFCQAKMPSIFFVWIFGTQQKTFLYGGKRCLMRHKMRKVDHTRGFILIFEYWSALMIDEYYSNLSEILCT